MVNKKLNKKGNQMDYYKSMVEGNCPMCKSKVVESGLAKDGSPLLKCVKCSVRMSKAKLDARIKETGVRPEEAETPASAEPVPQV